MTAIDLSSNAGLIGMGLLTLNVLLGLLISLRYNPRKKWPHRRVNIFQIHNWTAYIAISFILVHPLLLLFSSEPKFRILDILWPLHSPGQTLYNCLGATALYTALFVVITSYFRLSLAHRLWKNFHYVAYAVAVIVFTHGILEDPNLKSLPPDLLDGEKLLVEGCCALVIGATAWRVRYALRSK
jgi:predicted ferric reductase